MGGKDFWCPTIIERPVTRRSAHLHYPHHQEIRISGLPEQLARVGALLEGELVWSSHWSHVLEFVS